MDKETLKEYLSAKYQDSESFLKNIIFPIFGEEEFEYEHKTEYLKHHPERLALAKSTGIELIKQVGRIYVGAEPLQIFDITVSDRVMMERNRVNIQKLIRSIMDQYSCAFMIFHYIDTTRRDWRFSYCHKREYKEEFTDSKRYTFLLGPEQSCRTATENFMTIYEKRGNVQIDDIEMAFNVEALSKEFFTKYKDHYTRFVEYMVNTPVIRQDFIDITFDRTNLSEKQIRDREEKPIRDYVKKLLGRIVFLHFLQKKGWLGVPEGKEWGEGDRNFMLHLFEYASVEQKDNFLDNVLESLFDDALDTNRSDKKDMFDTRVDGFNKIRIPYLNGGLFERDALDEKTCRFPSKLFSDLLTMLSQYNFTIDENDPNDAEVGIDPEMLGRIFENLLEDNKDKGAFYTPKEIVQYMCRESLIAYLQTDQTDESKDAIRQFVLTHDAEQLPKDQKTVINDKLKEVKICDPAIGSGAFPMGLLRELFYCRSAIELDPEVESDENYAANIKRHIIQNNIYGVDIDHGAVDIARLRFWLSLVVDEKSPITLPNLDFKIMQGNSLLESYKGVDLSNLIQRKTEECQNQNLMPTLLDSVVDDWRKELYDTMNRYYSCGDHLLRQQLRHDIEELVRKQLKEQWYDEDLENISIYQNSEFFLWHTWFSDVFSRPSKGGFDIVIGNPPYISAPNQIALPELNKQRTQIIASGNYKSLNEKWDLYIPFMELGLQLLCNDGIFSMIVPYPLVNQKYAKKMRKMLAEQYCLLEIVDLNGTKIFENVTVSNCITFVRKSKPDSELIISHRSESKDIAEAYRKKTAQLTQNKRTYVWNLTEEEQTSNLYSNMHTLADICYISKGMVVNADEKEEQGAFKKGDLISDTYDSVHCRKYIEAKDIDKYQVKRVRYLEWNTERCPNRLSRPTFRELYDCPKLMINRLGELKVYFDAETHYLHSDSMFSAVLWKDLKSVNNKSITSSVKKFCKLQRKELEKLSEDINLYYLLGILNSSMVGRILDEIRGGDYHIYPDHLRYIPIPIPTSKIQASIGDIAKEILTLKAKSEDCQYLEHRLNELVEQLYNT